jgi:mannose-1-phosphate guanylyltransferase
VYIVILAGGSGTRFWPLSRVKNPKQLMSIFGGKSMLQRTVERVIPLQPKRILVVTNELQTRKTLAQLEPYRDQLRFDVISEPVGRNTAPAIGLAASIIARYDPSGVMVVLPADHYIADEQGFRATLLEGREAALNGYLVTMGIVPTRPETGYGYIEAETELRGDGPYPVRRFVEKPNLEKALEFLNDGSYYWNSGMFVWRADVILDQLLAHMPRLARALAMLSFSSDIWELDDLKPQIAAIYRDIEGESIDYGVMEKADNVVVIPAAFGWSDVGSWGAIPEVVSGDSSGNVLIDARHDVNIDSGNCLAYAGGRAVAFVGVWDTIVVATDDALLVCAKERSQDVKKVVEELTGRGLTEYL